MNRRTWKEFLTNRSTIWTLSLCLVGAIVLGGIAAVHSSRDTQDAASETEAGQIAYLEEDLNSADEGDSIQADNPDTLAGLNTDGNEAAGSTESAGNGENATEASDMSTTGSADAADTGSSSDADLSENASSEISADDDSGPNSSDTASAEADDDESSGTDAADTDSSDTEEAASANVISEQLLLEAGVSFSEEQSLLWPSAGTIAIDYSMDKSVYFATLNQYKYNPALIISSSAGNQVLASAKGIVESIYIDEETGTTLILNIGNGYQLTYGQLMEPAVSEGDLVEAGDLLAYISEPTKYYSIEGSSLYFAMTKDGEPVDPVLYLE